MGLTYKDSGVDIDKGNSFVKRLAPIVKSTFSNKVLNDIGGFGSLYSGAFPEMKEPVLVSGTDGVGTKLKIAQVLNIHDTIGIDAIAMCVNDILTLGAKPLFFLDYIACGSLNEDVLIDIIKGLAEGCKIAGCSLIGGETAEHPNIMEANDYDIAGFSVGVVDRSKIISPENVKKGDIIIGLPSSGIHSNGYSLVRKLFFDLKKYSPDKKFNELDKPLGQTLLTPTKIYCKEILKCIESGIKINSMVHITGGGFYENIPRVLPKNTTAIIKKSSFEILPIFKIMQKEGNIEDREMFTVFNMGIGLMLVVSPSDETKLLNCLSESGIKASVIGEITGYKNAGVVIE